MEVSDLNKEKANDQTLSEEAFASVVVADVDGRDMKSSQMAAAALRHLRSGNGFVQVPHGPDPSSEYSDPNLFPLLYPTLFPYGCGGFSFKTRDSALSMRNQAMHFIRLNDRRFQEHYSFLFTVFNMLQRQAVSLHSTIKVNRSNYTRIAEKISQVSDTAIHTMLERLSSCDSVVAETEEERTVQKLMKEINLVSAKIDGSSASKLTSRNKIRAMTLDLGLPTFYITINPADVYSPVLRFMSGKDFDLDNMESTDVPSYWDQAIQVSRNPFLAAKFFDVFIRAFVKHLLGWKGHGKANDGLLGNISGYFGCVTAQGRGTCIATWWRGLPMPWTLTRSNIAC